MIPQRVTAALTGVMLVLVTRVLCAETYTITDIEYRSVGRSRIWAIQENLDIEIGQIFPDERSLLLFLADQKQVLLNERVLHDASVLYFLRDDDPKTDTREVVVEIKTRDTWNVFVLPYVKYDSNTGLLLSLRGRDYNFFGTLRELEIDLDYEHTEDNEDLFTLSGNFSIPVRIMNRRYAFSMDQGVTLEGESVAYGLDVGTGIGFSLFNQEWAASYTQKYRYDSNDEYDDVSYFGNRIDVEAEIKTGVDLPLWHRLTYTPNLFTYAYYKPGGISPERDGLHVGFDHSFNAGRIDWLGNYRNGTEIELRSRNEYDLIDQKLSDSLEFSVTGHRAFSKAGVGGRLFSFYEITGADPDQDDAAKQIRGVLNDRMNGDVGMILNLDSILTVWTLRPLFEAQVGLFFDTALVLDTRGDFDNDSAFVSDRDLRYGTGLEVVGFPLFARSLYIRGSYGFDVRDVIQEGLSPLDSNVREIFIGLGHHY